MIIYDLFETWDQSFGETIINLVGQSAVDSHRKMTFQYIQDAGDHIANHTDVSTASTAIQSWIAANVFCVYHGTRLLGREIHSIRQDGLRPLIAKDRESRLRAIFHQSPRWSIVKSKLAPAIEDIGSKGKYGSREGQIHFSLSRSGLENDFDHYLNYGSEFDQHVANDLFNDQTGLQLLKSATVPLLLHVQVSGDQLINGAHPIYSYDDIIASEEIPGLARTFLNTWAYKISNPNFDIKKLRTDCCMMLKNTIPPSHIIKIEELSRP
ncbi:hypothetical protein [Paracoccus cavernae]|uniref:hypothetical protein n=1 Tax=Paracoccus cavernae TaxID=1571207 RepID=UPI0035F3E7BA